ncbi:MAG TPA: hypothetical protein VIT45_01985 [Allosphingosinicella sp.]
MDLTLISIVVGLGLTELLLTFYQIVRARRRVKWDALPLVWALLILIGVVNYWWGIRAIMAQASGWTTGTFMLTMISPVFIFLACAAALPRVEPGAPVDMKAAYADERTAFFLFFLAYQGGNWIIDIAGLAGPLPMIVAIHRGAICAALIIALVARSRRWDWAAAAVVAAAYASRLITQLAA